MIDLLLQELSSSWQSQLEREGMVLQPPFVALQVGSGFGSFRKINFLLFESGAKAPSLVLKVSRDSNHQSFLMNEYRALNQVWDEAGFFTGIPRALGLFEMEGMQVLVETYVPGIPMAVLLQRRLLTRPSNVRDDLSYAHLWLRQLQQATFDDLEPFPAQMLVELSLARLQDDIVPHSFTHNLMARAKEWERFDLPRVGRHGDYWPGNLLVGEGTAAVIDWENYTPRDLPFFDLYSFVVTYSLALPWRRGKRLSREERFARAFLDDGWLGNELLSCVNQHLDAFSLPRHSAAFFFGLFLLEKALPALKKRPGNRQQRRQWLDILRLYAENERHSILVKQC
jgi:hypothetical protein